MFGAARANVPARYRGRAFGLLAAAWTWTTIWFAEMTISFLDAGAEERPSDVALRRVPFGLFAIFLSPSLYRAPRGAGGGDADDGGDGRGADDGGCGAAAFARRGGLCLAVLLTLGTHSLPLVDLGTAAGAAVYAAAAARCCWLVRRDAAADAAGERDERIRLLAGDVGPVGARLAKRRGVGPLAALLRRAAGSPGFRALWAVSFCVLGTNQVRRERSLSP